jgi:hypothetical protein
VVSGSVSIYLQFFEGGLISYLRYLCLFSYSGAQHILCCVFVLFVLFIHCCQFLWIDPSWLLNRKPQRPPQHGTQNVKTHTRMTQKTKKSSNTDPTKKRAALGWPRRVSCPDFCLCLRFFYWIMELFRQYCVLLFFHFFCI